MQPKPRSPRMTVVSVSPICTKVGEAVTCNVQGLARPRDVPMAEERAASGKKLRGLATTFGLLGGKVAHERLRDGEAKARHAG